MSLSEFLQKGWADHGEDEDGVFARLPEGISLASEPLHALQLAGLIVHVSGEHLGRWDDGLALVERAQTAAQIEAGSKESASLNRSRAILHLGAGRLPEFEQCLADGASGDFPPASDRIRVLATAASALAGQKRVDEAIQRFEEALALAEYGPTKDDPAARALAITGNNLASDLEERAERTPAETSLMKTAALTGRKYWGLVGTWMNVERAECQLAWAYIAAGEPQQAAGHAAACLAICQAHGADPAELFFAHQAVATAQHGAGHGEAATAARDAAAACVAQVTDEGMKSYCDEELAKLDALRAE